MSVKNALAEKIAGEITLSPKPGQTIRKWRKIFKISQSELAYFLDTYPSVICDYESGRRKSPGIQTVRKIVTAFLEIDAKKNSERILNRYQLFIKKDEGVSPVLGSMATMLPILFCNNCPLISIFNKYSYYSSIFTHCCRVYFWDVGKPDWY